MTKKIKQAKAETLEQIKTLVLNSIQLQHLPDGTLLSTIDGVKLFETIEQMLKELAND